MISTVKANRTTILSNGTWVHDGHLYTIWRYVGMHIILYCAAKSFKVSWDEFDAIFDAVPESCYEV